MKVTRKEVVFTGHFLRLVNQSFETERGEKGVWETVERTNIQSNMGAVVLVPITREKEVVLERNYRVPVQSYVLQFPAGLCDVEGECEEDTARRELLDETGYKAGSLIPITIAPEDCVLTPSGVSHFLAPDVEFVGKTKRDMAEETEVIKVPLAKLTDFLLNPPRDTLLDLRVPGILWILEKKGLI